MASLHEAVGQTQRRLAEIRQEAESLRDRFRDSLARAAEAADKVLRERLHEGIGVAGRSLAAAAEKLVLWAGEPVERARRETEAASRAVDALRRQAALGLDLTAALAEDSRRAREALAVARDQAAFAAAEAQDVSLRVAVLRRAVDDHQAALSAAPEPRAGHVIPAEQLAPAARADNGDDRARLGLVVDPEATVLEVEPDSPADRAGVQAGDKVRAVDGKDVAAADDLCRVVAEAPPDHDIALTVKRGEAEEQVVVHPTAP